MIRTGWGVVYEQGGAQYGNWDKELYMAAEAEARCVAFFFLFFPFLSRLLGPTYLAVDGLGSGRREEAYGKVARTSRRPQSIRSDIVWGQNMLRNQRT